MLCYFLSAGEAEVKVAVENIPHMRLGCLELYYHLSRMKPFFICYSRPVVGESLKTDN
jgi:hypothetical protein